MPVSFQGSVPDDGISEIVGDKLRSLDTSAGDQWLKLQSLAKYNDQYYQ